MVSRIQGNPRVDGMLAGSSGNNNHRLSTASVVTLWTQHVHFNLLNHTPITQEIKPKRGREKRPNGGNRNNVRRKRGISSHRPRHNIAGSRRWRRRK